MIKYPYVKWLVITCLTILPFARVFSQKNYIPGYIVSNTGDTIKGKIDFRDQVGCPEQITFCAEGQNTTVNYTANDLMAYGFSGSVYISALVEIETSPRTINALNWLPEFQLIQKKVFLEELISGPKSLYMYYSSGTEDQFYIRTDSTLMLLLFKKYLREQDHEYIPISNKKYVGQLMIYLQGCKKIQPMITEITYDRKSLFKLFSNYYRCTSESIAYQKPIKRRKHEIGILACSNLNAITYRDQYLENNHSIKMMKYSFSPGIYFCHYFMHGLDRWLLYTDLSVTYFNFEKDFTKTWAPEKYTEYHTTVNSACLNISSALRYKYSIGKYPAFLNAGFNLITQTRGSKIYKKEINYDMIRKDWIDANSGAFHWGIVLGGGIYMKKFSVEARIQPLILPKRSSDLVTLNNQVSLNVGYYFGKLK